MTILALLRDDLKGLETRLKRRGRRGSGPVGGVRLLLRVAKGCCGGYGDSETTGCADRKSRCLRRHRPCGRIERERLAERMKTGRHMTESTEIARQPRRETSRRANQPPLQAILSNADALERLDVDKVRELAELHLKLEANEARKAFAAAFSAWHRRTWSPWRSTWQQQLTPTEPIRRACGTWCAMLRPVLTRHGLSRSFSQVPQRRRGTAAVPTSASGIEDGHHEESHFMEALPDMRGPKGNIDQDRPAWASERRPRPTASGICSSARSSASSLAERSTTTATRARALIRRRPSGPERGAEIAALIERAGADEEHARKLLPGRVAGGHDAGRR